MNETINKRQLSIMFLFILPISKLMLLPTLMSYVAGRDSYLAVIFIMAADILILWLIVRFIKASPESEFNGFLNSNFGKTASKIILFSYGILFLIKSLPLMLEQKLLLENTFYESFPLIISFIPFFFLIFFIAIKGAKVIGRTSELFWVLILISFVIVVAFSFGKADFKNILPIGYNGVSPIAKAVFSFIQYFGDYIILFAFMGKIDKDKSFKKIFISAGVVAGMVILVFLIFTAIFGDVAIRQTYAITKISKYSLAVSELGRFDFIAILLLLSGSLFHSAVLLFASAEMFRQAFNLKERKWILVALIVFLAVGIYIFSSKYFMLNAFYAKYLNYFFILMQYFMPVILTAPVLIKRKDFRKKIVGGNA